MAQTVRKADLAEAVATALGITKKRGEQAVEAVLQCIESTLQAGGKVQLSGFGSFEVRSRGQRKARNPRSPHEEIIIPASKAPAFKAGKGLKDAVQR
jgi:DNA-binding protein HU-beta